MSECKFQQLIDLYYQDNHHELEAVTTVSAEVFDEALSVFKQSTTWLPQPVEQRVDTYRNLNSSTCLRRSIYTTPRTATEYMVKQKRRAEFVENIRIPGQHIKFCLKHEQPSTQLEWDAVAMSSHTLCIPLTTRQVHRHVFLHPQRYLEVCFSEVAQSDVQDGLRYEIEVECKFPRIVVPSPPVVGTAQVILETACRLAEFCATSECVVV